MSDGPSDGPSGGPSGGPGRFVVSVGTLWSRSSNPGFVLMPTTNRFSRPQAIPAVCHTLAAALVLCTGGAVSAQAPQPQYARIEKPALSTAQIAQRALPATATIVTVDAKGDTIGLGSGFFMLHDGQDQNLFVTNWHVMRGAVNATVTRDRGHPSLRVGFVAGDSLLDVAILKVTGPGRGALAPTRAIPDVGERVIAIGSPRGLASTVTEGIVSARREAWGNEMVQISAQISPGSSGGAVLDDKGRVFAIATAYFKDAQQLNFAVPVSVAMDLLPDSTRDLPLDLVFAPRSAQPDRSVGLLSNESIRRTARPRVSLEGAWEISVERLTRDGREKVGDLGLMVAGKEVSVFAVYSDLSKSPSDVSYARNIHSVRTNVTGKVSMTMGPAALEGYQTDWGFLVSRDGLDAPDVGKAVLVGSSVQSYPANPTGVYHMQGSMADYPGNGASGTSGPTKWSGEAAIIKSESIVIMGFRLYNARGETIGWDFAISDLGPDGTFTLMNGNLSVRARIKDDLAARFVGLIRIVGSDGRIYEGTLTGFRR